jgi:hypothetical protein
MPKPPPFEKLGKMVSRKITRTQTTTLTVEFSSEELIEILRKELSLSPEVKLSLDYPEYGVDGDGVSLVGISETREEELHAIEI